MENQSSIGVTTTIESMFAPSSKIDKVIEGNRPILRQWGEQIGSQLHTVISYNPDLTFNEDLLAGTNGLRKEIKLFVIQSINIKSVDIIETIGGEVKIEFNKDPKFRYDVVPPQFKEANCANVRNAVEAFEKKLSPIFFPSSALPMLREEINGSNEASMRKFEELSKKFLQNASTARQLIEQTSRKCDEYLRQVGISSNTGQTTQVNVTVVQELKNLKKDETSFLFS